MSRANVEVTTVELYDFVRPASREKSSRLIKSPVPKGRRLSKGIVAERDGPANRLSNRAERE